MLIHYINAFYNSKRMTHFHIFIITRTVFKICSNFYITPRNRKRCAQRCCRFTIRTGWTFCTIWICTIIPHFVGITTPPVLHGAQQLGPVRRHMPDASVHSSHSKTAHPSEHTSNDANDNNNRYGFFISFPF